MILATFHMGRVGQNRIYTVYDRIFGDFPAKKIVYTVPLWTHPAPPNK
jgi:hypothetical protein